jgi:predicted transcriptional regulator of viral defense system
MNNPLPTQRQGAYEAGRSTSWAYVMLSREQSRLILKRILDSRRPLKTLAVWEVVRSYAEWNTGNITTPVPIIAEAADTTPTEVYRALSHLVQLGALVRIGRGRYALNPNAAWSGSLVQREEALHPA